MKTRPMLVALLPLEGGGWQLRVVADSYEDEQRLLVWLRRAGVVDALGHVLREALEGA